MYNHSLRKGLLVTLPVLILSRHREVPNVEDAVRPEGVERLAPLQDQLVEAQAGQTLHCDVTHQKLDLGITLTL